VRPRIGLTLLQEDAYRIAAGPLYASGEVEVLECDVDAGWSYGRTRHRLPPWRGKLLDLYAEAGALYGHGVWFSFLSARLEPRQRAWLRALRRECEGRAYRHVSEHFGFLTAGSFTEGTTFIVPKSEAAVRIGIDRLARIRDAAKLPAGLENTPVCYCAQDATEQGPFLSEILEGADGFLLLDLHNLYTQAYNVGLSARRLLGTYPLHRVREIHVSGGSWVLPDQTRRSTGELRADDDVPVRLDSHCGRVPDEVIALLRLALPRCPNLEAVFLERVGGTLETEEQRSQYRDDFARMRAAVEAYRG
jgi:uncharacterized protein (UPF0276 family)